MIPTLCTHGLLEGSCADCWHSNGHKPSVVGPTVSTAPTVSTVTTGGSDDVVSTAPTVSTVTKGGFGDVTTALFADLENHFARYVLPLDALDTTVLALWCAHTWLVERMWTTPRLCITSPLPGSGKTTVLEHFQHLCLNPISMASAGSPALLARMLSAGMRTLLIDEADKNLRRDKPDIADLMAILNTGYKKGGTRPVLSPGKGGDWVVVEMPTYSPFAMAGISPDLMDDTVSRTIFVTMLPDLEGRTEESDWERIERDVHALADRLSKWAESVAHVPDADHLLPPGCIGRMREKWRPLMRTAVLAGGGFPERCRQLIDREVQQVSHDREEGLMREIPALVLLKHIVDEWPPGIEHWRTSLIVQALTERHPNEWGVSERYPKGLTAQRVGRYLGKNFMIRSGKPGDSDVRGYFRSDVEKVAGRLGITPPDVTVETVLTVERNGS